MAHPLLDNPRPQSLAEIRNQLGATSKQRFSPSSDWRDQILYFLMPDRFSDGKEKNRPLLTRDEIRNFRQNPSRPGWNWELWAESGKRWQGGTIKGIQSKLDYLQQLGVTAVWVGPVFKQRAKLDTYHGYGIQDFLEVDPRYGTRKDLVKMVEAAHKKGISVILDIIMNHTGDNWGYVQNGQERGAPYISWPKFYSDPNDVELSQWETWWRNSDNQPVSDQQLNGDPHAAVYPSELRDRDFYTRAGGTDLGSGSLFDPHAPHKRSDFFSLKDLATDKKEALNILAECYKYWIDLTDCDGFRIDTVKHISIEESRAFCGAIKEFAERIGKKHFLLVGEVAGGNFAQDVYLDQLAVLQRNLDAALDIGEARVQLGDVAKGLTSAGSYLNGFKASSEGFESHRAIGNRHLSILDDHDHVFGAKLRFSSTIPDDSPVKDYQVVAATAIQLFTLGIPCLYYGTEQAFAGPAQSQLVYLSNQGWGGGDHADRYLREAMFGPKHPRKEHSFPIEEQVSKTDASLPGFGPFGTTGKHCFDQNSPSYIRIAHLTRARALNPLLRTGRQYARALRLPGTDFIFPGAGELITWSRILDTVEILCVVNGNGASYRGGDVVVDAELSPPGTEFTVIANTAEAAAGATYNGSHPLGSKVRVEGRSYPGEPAYLPIRDIGPAEVLLLSN